MSAIAPVNPAVQTFSALQAGNAVRAVSPVFRNRTNSASTEKLAQDTARLLGQREIGKLSDSFKQFSPQQNTAKLAGRIEIESFGQPGTAYGMQTSELRLISSERKLSRLFGKDSSPTSETTPENSASSAIRAQAPESPVPDEPEMDQETAKATAADGLGETEAENKKDKSAEEQSLGAPRGADGDPLSESEVDMLNELKKRDAEIRTHEQAHIAAGGGLVRGGVSYEYQVGPDGKRYAVGGEVQIDSSGGSSPEETLQKMRTVRAAALAPAEPSPQDRRVAAQASRRENSARREMLEAQVEAARTEREARAARNDENQQTKTQDDNNNLNTANEIAKENGDTEETNAFVDQEKASPERPSMVVSPEEKSPSDINQRGISIMENIIETAKRNMAKKAYAAAERPDPLKPDARSMQPGHTRNIGVTAVPTLQPQPGSNADIDALGQE